MSARIGDGVDWLRLLDSERSRLNVTAARRIGYLLAAVCCLGGVGEIGRLRSTAEVGRTAETAAFGEIIARAAGSGTGVEASTAVAPDVAWLCASVGACAAQAASRRAGSASAIRAVFEVWLRLTVSPC